MLRYWIWLSTRKNLGNRKKISVLEHFGSPESAYLADELAYRDLTELSRQDRKELMDKSLKEAEHILRTCDNRRISIMTWGDAAYPTRLKTISDPPVVLYYEGHMPNLETAAAIGMVGTRKASAYGMKHAKELGYQLGRGGAVIISGMAEGIDCMCLEGALSSGTPVISVLGNGVDVVYPKCNRRYYEDVRRNGCLLSEYPPGTPPDKHHFPTRNRLISGLALGVVVVEAPAKRSGALITARTALEQGRDVFTIPANLDVPTCAGNVKLLKEGAILVEDGSDVLREYAGRFALDLKRFPADFQTVESKAAVPVQQKIDVPAGQDDKKSIDKKNPENYIDLEKVMGEVSAESSAILHALCNGDLHVDELVDRTRLSASQVSTAMTILQIKKLVKRLPGMRYALAENIKVGEHHE